MYFKTLYTPNSKEKQNLVSFFSPSISEIVLFCFMLSMLKQWARNMTWYYEKMEGGWCKVFSHNLKL